MATRQPDLARLRVLLTVHHHLERGQGASGSTIVLAEALERRGHAVEVVGLGLLRRSRGSLFDAVSFPRAVARLVERRLDRGDLDVIDASSGDLGAVAASRIHGAPVAVFTRSHGLEHLADAARRAAATDGELSLRWRYSLYHGGYRLREVARSFTCADGALLLNDAEEQYVTSALGVPGERVFRTTPLAGAELEVLSRDERRDVLVLGPSSWRKGGDVATRVLEAVLRAVPSTTATWAGLDDPARTAARLGDDVAARVRLTGRYDRGEEAALLASHRVLLFASRFEGLPVTLLEALGAGIAVVGSDVPGVRDLLGDGAGVLVAAGHTEGFVVAVRALLADPARRHLCAALGVATAAALRSGPVVDRLEGVYRTVLARKRPGP